MDGTDLLILGLILLLISTLGIAHEIGYSRGSRMTENKLLTYYTESQERTMSHMRGIDASRAECYAEVELFKNESRSFAEMRNDCVSELLKLKGYHLD